MTSQCLGCGEAIPDVQIRCFACSRYDGRRYRRRSTSYYEICHDGFRYLSNPMPVIELLADRTSDPLWRRDGLCHGCEHWSAAKGLGELPRRPGAPDPTSSCYHCWYSLLGVVAESKPARNGQAQHPFQLARNDRPVEASVDGIRYIRHLGPEQISWKNGRIHIDHGRQQPAPPPPEPLRQSLIPGEFRQWWFAYRALLDWVQFVFPNESVWLAWIRSRYQTPVAATVAEQRKQIRELLLSLSRDELVQFQIEVRSLREVVAA